MFWSRNIKRADPILIIAALTLVAVGCLMIFSCTRTGLGGGTEAQWARVKAQLIWVALGLIVLLLTMAFDYERLPGVYLPVYGLTLVLLAVVLFMPPVRGTHRWIILGPLHLQPSELAQVALLITIACIASTRERVDDFFTLTKTFAWLLPPIALILKQPDLGTPIILLSMWFVIMLFAGARWSHLGGYAVALLLLFSAAWFSGAIKDYQKSRLLIFLHPEDDPTDEGYQSLQALIAVGNGGLFGRGLFRGPQTGGHFVPDQYTDFIFTAVAEELGFVGAVAVLVLFGIILWRCTVALAEAKDTLGRLVAAGVIAVLGMHVVANVAMTVGLAPVKGMPLPFMSYGGSSMVTSMIAIGLVENVYMRRHKIAF